MYTWTKDLETGNTMIDQQHKQWIDMLNQLLAACSQGKGRDNMRSTLIFLQDYTTKHFKDEEALQVKCRFSEYSVHKGYHETFKSLLREIVTEFDQNGPTVVLLGKINTSLGSWFINHIKKEDLKVARQLQTV